MKIILVLFLIVGISKQKINVGPNIAQKSSQGETINEHRYVQGIKSFTITTGRARSTHYMEDVPEISVTFKDGTKDVFILQRFSPLAYSSEINHTKLCNYMGHLQHETDSVVAVTGCLETRGSNPKVYITMLSERSIYQKYFLVDKYGNFEAIKTTDFYTNKTSSRINGKFVEGDELGDIEEEEEAHKVIIGGKNKVPFAIKVTIKVGVDRSARKTIVSRLDTSVDQWLSDVLTHVQAIFHHPTLHHRINFEVSKDTMDFDDSLDVTLRDLKKLSVKTMELNESHVDIYSWVVDGGGDYGMSWLGAACKLGTGEKSKTTLVRGPSRYHGVIETAETLAHEIGHNLGMEHDFYTSKSACKLDVDGSFVWCNQCTNWDHHGNMLTIEFGESGECCTGFMDYGNHPEYWSICSVRDFEQHYVSQNWSECLPEDTDDKGHKDEKWDVVCFNVETITKKWANEISWSVGSCKSTGRHTCTANGGYFDNMNFTQPCCLSPGDHQLTCYDCYGDTWKGGYLLIDGVKYCEDFTGMAHNEIISLSENKKMKYENVKMYHVFFDEGKGVDNKYGISLSHCKEMCSKSLGCKSFAYCSKSDGKDIPEDEGRCHLKDKNGSRTHAVKKSEDCTSYFQQHKLDKSTYNSHV